MLTDNVPQICHIALKQMAFCRLEFQSMVVEALKYFKVTQVTIKIQYPLARSNVEYHLADLSPVKASSIRGNG